MQGKKRELRANSSHTDSCFFIYQTNVINCFNYLITVTKSNSLNHSNVRNLSCQASGEVYFKNWYGVNINAFFSLYFRYPSGTQTLYKNNFMC